MIQPDWILRERSGHWAAALRLTLLRTEAADPMPRIFEARNLRDLVARLEARPASLVLIEVVRTNLSGMLNWLMNAAPQFPAAHFAALLDGELAESLVLRQIATEALLEAGVSDFAFSPRHLHDVLALGRRHAEVAAMRAPQPASKSIEAWAWASLPWQDE